MAALISILSMPLTKIALSGLVVHPGRNSAHWCERVPLNQHLHHVEIKDVLNARAGTLRKTFPNAILVNSGLSSGPYSDIETDDNER